MTVTFKRSNKDTGVLGDSDSIQPIYDNELIVDTVLSRPDDNLRVRSEELARAVESVEYIVQSANNASILLRYVDSTNAVVAGLLKVYYKVDGNNVKYYYITAATPAAVTTGTFPSMIIVGSATNGFNYILHGANFEAFYDQASSSALIANHNTYLGLNNPGDCLALRIPTVSSTYSSEVMLPETTSAFSSAGEAELATTLLGALTTGSVTNAQAKYSLIKIPAKNSIEITTIAGALEDLLAAAVADVGTGAVTDSLTFRALLTTGVALADVTLDIKGIIKEGSKYIIPRSGYRDLEHLVSPASLAEYQFSIKGQAYSLYGATVAVRSTTLLPKNEYLYPVAKFTGDSVLIPGLGGVNTIDVISRGGEAYVDQAGIVLGETGTAVKAFETRTNISYSELAGTYASLLLGQSSTFWGPYFRLPIDIYIPEAGTSADLYLDALEIHMVNIENNIPPGSNQVIRDVYVGMGMYNLISDIGSFTFQGTKLSLPSCLFKYTKVDNSISNPDFKKAALPKTILKHFDLTTMQDDYVAHVELPDSIRNTNGSGKTIIVWLYSKDAAESNFFNPNNPGKFNLDFRFKWTTRVPDATNLASDAALNALS